MLQHFMLIPATAIVRCQKKPHLCYITCMDSNSRNTRSLLECALFPYQSQYTTAGTLKQEQPSYSETTCRLLWLVFSAWSWFAVLRHIQESDFPDILVNMTVATLSLSECWILGCMGGP